MLTVLLPYRAGKPPALKAQRIESPGAIGVRLLLDGKPVNVAFRRAEAAGDGLLERPEVRRSGVGEVTCIPRSRTGRCPEEQMTDNPYASPADYNPSSGGRETEATTKTRIVIRVFRYIGWPGAILFCSLSLFLFFCAFVHLDDWSAHFGIVGMVFLGLAGYFVLALRVASRMARRDRRVKLQAQLVCLPLLLVFPLLTIVSLMCLTKIWQYYDEYCKEAAADVEQVANLSERRPVGNLPHE